MSELYPDESQKLNVIGHLEELRWRILICLGWVLGLSLLFAAKGDWILALVKRPISPIVQNLFFMGPAEAFSAYVKVVLLAGVILSFPLILHQAWAFFSLALPKNARPNILRWLFAAMALFYAGILFAYFVLIPAALSFLIGFGRGFAIPVITLDRYVSFFVSFVLISGAVFEIPVVIALLTDLGFLKSRTLKQKRPVASVVILIIAGVVTPTQDIFNMLLFAFPMFLLYELGVWISAAIERRKRTHPADTARP